MHSRIKSVVSAIILIFVFSILFAPGQYFAAEESEGSHAIHTQGLWLNPYYINNFTESQPVPSIQPMEEPVAQSVGNMTDFQSVLRDALNNRQTSIPIIYTGAISDLGYTDDLGNFQVDGVLDLIDSVMGVDDYLRFNIMTKGIPFSLNGTPGNILINFTVSYLTTLAEENQVDTEVTAILSNIIEPGMNPHQKVKAIHDYIVANVAYDTDLEKHSVYAALFGEKETVCQGYALLAFKMLTETGFEARIIGGYADNGSGPISHAWNRVLLDGKWYNLDCTWDDPIPDDPGRVIYSYYLVMDDELVDHFADDEYTGLPVSAESYTTTLENLITANPANEIYPRLQQQLGFNYYHAVNTAENVAELEAKWLAAAQEGISNYKVRYNISSDDLGGTTLEEMFYRIADVTDLNEFSLSYGDYNRGAGTGYVLLDFDLSYFSANTAPTASAVTISGNANVGQVLTGSYTYADAEGNAEGLSQYQWYRGSNSDGSDKAPIPGAIATHYTASTRDAGKYLFFEVMPIASVGTLQGTSVLSAASAVVGPKLEETDECFIATAAFGSKFDWPVALLRHFRDQYLLTNPAGRAFVDFYYHNSPPIAAFIAGSEPLKALVRVLLAPVIAIVYMIYHPALMAMLLIFVVVTCHIWRRRRIKTA